MFYEHFPATGADDLALDLSDLFTVPLQGDDIQDFDTKWDQALLAASEIRKENVLGSVLRDENTWICSASDRISDVRTRN